MNTIQSLAMRGRGGDSMLAHVTPGDVVVPRFIAEKDPSILSRLKKNFEEEGRDYRDHIVGSDINSINPETGMPEFGWFSFKNIFKTAAPILGAIAGTALGGPWGGAAGSALGSKLSGGSTTDALLSGAGAGLGSAFLGVGSGDIAGNLTKNSLTRGIGGALASGLPSVGGIGVNGLTGALAGKSLADIVGRGTAIPTGEAGGYESFSPENLDISRPADMAIPGGMGELGNLSDVQRTSNIATQGVEGQGASPDAQAYFINQIRRRLTDANSTANEVNPIEQSYLNRIGVSYQPGDVKSILEGIARQQNAAAKTLT
jgi:hypothetical protein